MAKGLWRKLRALTGQRKGDSNRAVAAPSGGAGREGALRAWGRASGITAPRLTPMPFSPSVLEQFEDRLLLSVNPTANEQLMLE